MGSILEDRTRRIKGFIGGYLFEAGLITLEQLDKALERQLELIAQGRPLRLGEVLVEMGAVTREQLDQVQNRDSMDGERARPAQRDEERKH
jgi:hypothetical protein